MNKKYVTLKDVCEKASSSIAQKDLLGHEGIFPIYGAGGFIKNVDFYKQEKEYIAIVKDGAGIGRAMKLPAHSSVIGTMQYIIPKENVNISYLYYAICAMHLEKYFSGATIPHIYFKDYQKEKLYLPSLAEQEKIASIFEILERLIANKKKQLDNLGLLVQSRFIEMFGGIHDSGLYPYTKIESFASVVSGGTPDRGTIEFWKGGNIRWVKTTELQNCVITDTEEKITQVGMNNSAAKLIPINSVLIAMYGQGKTRGMTGYTSVECTTNQACACILPSESVNQKYLWQYMILSYDKLRSMAKGGNQPNLNAGIIKKFPVLMPPLERQNEFVAFCEQTDKSKYRGEKSWHFLYVFYKKAMNMI